MGAGATKAAIIAQGYDSDVDNELGYKYAGRREIVERADESGGQFTSSAPWTGALFAPKMGVEEEEEDASSVPSDQLVLDHIYGYRGHDARNNAFFMPDGRVVYFAAAAGIVQKPVMGVGGRIEAHPQKFYLEHDDDIMCMTASPDKKVFLSGQVGKDPKMCLWDAESLNTVGIIHGCHTNGVRAVAMSPSGKRIASVGMDVDNTIVVHEVHGEAIAILHTQRGGSNLLYQVTWIDESTFVTAGKNSVIFWAVGKDGKCTSKRGVFGVSGPATVLALAIVDGVLVTGDHQGGVARWKGNKLSKIVSAHQGPVFDICANGEYIISGGKDGRLCFLNRDNLELVKATDLREVSSQMADTYGRNLLYSTNRAPCIRSIDTLEEKVLVGTIANELILLTLKEEGSTDVSQACDAVLLVQGHAAGEVWGLDVHPSLPLVATASEDKTLRVWNSNDMRMMRMKKFTSKLKSVAFSPDGNFLATGSKKGSVYVIDAKSLETVASRRYRKEEISDLKFSPDGTKLAVASHDNFIDILEVSRGYKRCGICRGHSSYVTHIDWSADSEWIQSNSGDYELLFWHARTGEQMTRPSELADIEWATWSCILGWPVKGIWPTYADGTDINAVCRSRLKDCIATADDFGMVNIFKYPCDKPGCEYRRYPGHSAHVANIKFSSDDQFVFSAGGADTTLFQWKHVDERFGVSEVVDDDAKMESKNSNYAEKASFKLKPALRPPPPPLDSDDESEPEEDDEEEEKTEVDGEVLPVKPKPALSKAWFSANCPWLGAVFPPDSPPEIAKSKPEKKLELEYVHGMRGHDARDNLFFLESGEIIYTSAAVVIVHNFESNEQRFYRGHTDDIVSLAVHPNGRYVATGQIGRDPLIIVWDTVKMKRIRTLEGFHTNAICSLGFSPDGNLIASVGADTKHTLAIWKWKSKKVVANYPGHSDKIVSVDFNPHNPSSVVSCGINHIKFWTLQDGRLSARKGVFGDKGKLQTMHSITFVEGDVTLAGTQTGDVYKWKKNMLVQALNNIHSGPVVALHACENGVATGGREGKIKLWTKDLEPYEGPNKEFDFTSFTGKSALGHYVRSCAWKGDKLVVGMMTSEVYLVDVPSGEITPINSGLGEGEVWGLATHPTDPNIYVTAAEDKSLRVWNLESHSSIKFKHLEKGGFCVCYSPDASLIAVGLDLGSFVVIDAESMEVIVTKNDRVERISDIKFSPDGNLLGVASHDNFVDIYEVGSYDLKGTCKGHSSFITHFDWSSDSQYLMSTCGAYELLFWNASDASQIKWPSKLRNIEWATFTCVLGWSVQGIWPRGADGTDINAVDRSHSKNMLAVGDDFGACKLMDYPAVKPETPSFSGRGHSAHVTNVRFTADDSHVISIGGNDRTIMVWNLK